MLNYVVKCFNSIVTVILSFILIIRRQWIPFGMKEFMNYLKYSLYWISNPEGILLEMMFGTVWQEHKWIKTFIIYKTMSNSHDFHFVSTNHL